MDGNECGQGTARVCGRPGERALVDDRAVRALWRVPPHGLQVARTPSGRRGRGADRSQSRAAAVPASHERRAGSADHRRPAGVRLGREEAAAGAAHAAPEPGVAGAQYRSMRSSSGTGCCTSTAADGSGRIPARAPHRDATRRIRSGPRTSRASSARAMASTAIHSR